MAGLNDAVGTPQGRVAVGLVTTVGNHREQNEDNFFLPGLGTIAEFPEGLPSGVDAAIATNLRPSDRSRRPHGNLQELALDAGGLFLVADGMGGQLGGEQASRMAVEIIPREFDRRADALEDADAIASAIKEAVAVANREIIAQAHTIPEFSSMGTTVVLVLFRLDRAYIANVGDSRAYRLRDGRLERLTKDHDLASALITAGTIQPEEAEGHQFRHYLYLFLGCPEASEGPESVRVLDLAPGDRFLLASDGLTGSIRDEELAGMLGRGDAPQETARALVERALANESRDNVTCMVIHVEP